MKSALLVVILFSLTTGCTSVQRVKNFDSINKQGQTKVAELTLVSGEVLYAEGLRVSSDSSHWLSSSAQSTIYSRGTTQPPTLTAVTMPTADIRKIIFPSRVTGAKLGMLHGAWAGFLIGAYIGYRFEKRTSLPCSEQYEGPDMGPSSPWVFGPEKCRAKMAGLLQGTAFGLMGGALGAAIGGISRKGKREYRPQDIASRN